MIKSIFMVKEKITRFYNNKINLISDSDGVHLITQSVQEETFKNVEELISEKKKALIKEGAKIGLSFLLGAGFVVGGIIGTIKVFTSEELNKIEILSLPLPKAAVGGEIAFDAAALLILNQGRKSFNKVNLISKQIEKAQKKESS
jgi:hypothetical protein